MARRVHPVLVYDGDCAFCTRCARLAQRIAPDVEIVPWQLTDLAELGITEEQAADAVQWIQVDGTVESGHEAIAAMLSSGGWLWRIASRAMLLPGVSAMAAKAYRLVADNRHRLPGGTPACARDGALPHQQVEREAEAEADEQAGGDAEPPSLDPSSWPVEGGPDEEGQRRDR
jgi:predicted DCC family thiol-disulfide oxidoreductase YuxK